MIAVVLLIATITVTWQVKFMRDQPLGFTKQQMLVVSMPATPETDLHYKFYKEQMQRIRGVRSVSASAGIPGSQYGNALIEIENANGEMQKAGVDIFNIDEAFIQQYNIPLIAGRASSPDRFKEDIDNIVINEAALTKFGYSSPADAIGKRFQHEGKQIIGVVKNFHYRSFREQINPLIMVVNDRFLHYLTLNVSTEHLNKTISEIESTWNRLNPENPFSASFLEESFNRQFQNEQNFGRLFLYFSFLAIFISALGLYGLSLHTTLQRAREIGIRKVLGASVQKIVVLVTKDFLVPVGVALIIAFPLAGIAMNKWLENFVYRVSIHWWMFAVAGGIALLVAVMTVVVQSVKAAIANPVRTLRSE